MTPKAATGRPARRKWRIAGLACALLIGIIAVSAVRPGQPLLTVQLLDGGAPLLRLPLTPKRTFVLHYYHSVDQAPIWEVHWVDENGTIFIEEEILVMFGAGMGELPGRGRLTGRRGLQVIEGMHDPLGDEFVLRIGRRGVDHTIIVDGVGYNLSRAAAGEAARVSARPLGRLETMWRRLSPVVHPDLDPQPADYPRPSTD